MKGFLLEVSKIVLVLKGSQGLKLTFLPGGTGAPNFKKKLKAPAKCFGAPSLTQFIPSVTLLRV